MSCTAVNRCPKPRSVPALKSAACRVRRSAPVLRPAMRGLNQLRHQSTGAVGQQLCHPRRRLLVAQLGAQALLGSGVSIRGWKTWQASDSRQQRQPAPPELTDSRAPDLQHQSLACSFSMAFSGSAWMAGMEAPAIRWNRLSSRLALLRRMLYASQQYVCACAVVEASNEDAGCRTRQRRWLQSLLSVCGTGTHYLSAAAPLAHPSHLRQPTWNWR